MSSHVEAFARLLQIFQQSASTKADQDVALYWRIVCITCLSAFDGFDQASTIDRTRQILPSLQVYIRNHPKVLVHRSVIPAAEASSLVGKAERDLPALSRIPFAIWLVAYLKAVQRAACGRASDAVLDELSQRTDEILRTVLEVLCLNCVEEDGLVLARKIFNEMLNLARCDNEAILFRELLARNAVTVEESSAFNVFHLQLNPIEDLAVFRARQFASLAACMIDCPQLSDYIRDAESSILDHAASTISTAISFKGKSKQLPAGILAIAYSNFEAVLQTSRPESRCTAAITSSLFEVLFRALELPDTEVDTHWLCRSITRLVANAATDQNVQQILVQEICGLSAARLIVLQDCLAAIDSKPSELVAPMLLLVAFPLANNQSLLGMFRNQQITASVVAWASKITKAQAKHVNTFAMLKSQLNISNISTSNSRKRKRASLSEPVDNWRSIVDQILRKLVPNCQQLGTIETTLLAVIESAIKDSEDTSLIEAVGWIACARAGCLVVNQRDEGRLVFSCGLCDGDIDHSKTITGRCLTDKVIGGLLMLWDSEGDMARRCHILRSLCRILRHLRAGESILLLTPSHPIMAVVAELLESSHRSLRLLAKRVLVEFTKARLINNSHGLSVNDLLIPRLAQLASAAALPVRETSLLTLSSLSHILNDDLLSAALLPIVRNVGHETDAVACLCHTEILKTARLRNQTAYQLLAPSFTDISLEIVNTSKGQAILSALAPLIGSPERVILKSSTPTMLPILILHDRTSEIDHLAVCHNVSSRRLVTEMMAYILSYLFAQHQIDFERGVRNLLKFYDAHERLQVVLGSCLPEVLYHILVSGALPLDARQLKLVLHRMARICSSKQSTTNQDIQDLLLSHALAAISMANDHLTDMHGKKTSSEKVKIVTGLAVLIEHAGERIADLTPQIMATLQSTLRISALREATIRTWKLFMNTIPFAEAGPFIGQTCAAYARMWASMTEAERVIVRSMLDVLLLSRSPQQLQPFFTDIPSLEGLAGLEDLADKIVKMRKLQTTEDQVESILFRLVSENEQVCLRALYDLRKLLVDSRPYFRRLTVGDTFAGTVAPILKTTINAAVRPGEAWNDVRSLAFECIGLLGAVDPDRFEMPSEDAGFVVSRNFDDKSEAMDFALHLMTKTLVDAYRASNDTRHQTALAYAIQELLKFCHFSSKLLNPNAKDVPTAIRVRWEKMSKDTVAVVTPLLGSRFSMFAASAPVVPQRPIYKHVTTYRDWIRTWTLDMISHITSLNAMTIFHALQSVIKHGDVAVSRQLIPHLVLHLLLTGAKQQTTGTNAGSVDGIQKLVLPELLQVITDQLEPASRMSSDTRLLCAQTVFETLDHLSRWTRRQAQEISRLRARAKKLNNDVVDAVERDSRTVQTVIGILRQIPQDLQALAAENCKAHARALLNYESKLFEWRLKRSPAKTDAENAKSRIHKIYADLDEPDGMIGISSLISSPDLMHQIREHELTGEWTAAQSCWEILLQSDPGSSASHLGLLRCLRNLGHYDSMQTHLQGVLASQPVWAKDLLPMQAECALIMDDWQAVNDVLAKSADNSSPEVIFARVIRAMGSDSAAECEAALHTARQELGSKLLAAGQESYRRSYAGITHLHALQDIEAIYRASRSSDPAAYTSLSTTLSDRFELLAPSFSIQESVLSLRRAAFRVSKIEQQGSGSIWLQIAKIARNAGHFQTAYTAVLQASQLKFPFSEYESAKLQKAMGHSDRALKMLSTFYNANLPKDFTLGSAQTAYNIKPLAKLALLRAKWMVESERFTDIETATAFRSSTHLCADWEASHFMLAHHYDQMCIRASNGNQTFNTDTHRTFVAAAVRAYVRSLTAGSKYIYRAMPRLLTIFVDVGSHKDVMRSMKQKRKSSSKTPTSANFTPNSATLEGMFEGLIKLLQRALSKLPSWQWLTAFPQIVSRICQPNESAQAIWDGIMLRVLDDYPHHGVWAMIGVAKSTMQSRALRCLSLFEMARTRPEATAGDLIAEGQRLVNGLLQLCNYNPRDAEDLRMDKHFLTLERAVPCLLIVPLQSSLNITLPSSSANNRDHQPFAADLPTWTRFDNEVDVMSSLIRPKKITINASNGQRYSFLCKPKDDLRKDGRLMEFNSIINKLLKRDSEARRRHLHIRTYAVVPLNEDCGLIEWVPNTVALRSVLSKLYEARNIQPWSHDIKAIMEGIRGNLDRPDSKKLIAERFEKQVLSRYPSVFHEWFLDQFPEPSNWLRNRLAYSRTAAVISMVGFVLGLGDRHGENILLDSSNGDTVHVDFNCLFDKGRTFDIPEQVPFRLSHNVIDGFGITGVEGVFRRACEVTMRILRANHDSLMSVMEAFVHDPLLEWGKKKGKVVLTEAELNAAGRKEALKALEPISLKLKGLRITSEPIAPTTHDRASSIENQVESLISEATDSGNLGSMYVGWASWF